MAAAHEGSDKGRTLGPRAGTGRIGLQRRWAEDLDYYAQDDDALMDAAAQAGFKGEDVLEYFMELSPRERLRHLQRA